MTQVKLFMHYGTPQQDEELATLLDDRWKIEQFAGSSYSEGQGGAQKSVALILLTRRAFGPSGGRRATPGQGDQSHENEPGV